MSELPLASFSKRVLVPIVSYENEISFTSKLHSFSYEWLCPPGPFFVIDRLKALEWAILIRYFSKMVLHSNVFEFMFAVLSFFILL